MEVKSEAVSQLEYNSIREQLIIPEYGRHLQKLIDQITVIKDKEERNKAAKYVISVMGSLNPHLRDVPDFQHKLWDQLFIMSDFRLEVDSPYPIPSRDVLNQRPDTLNYPQNFPKYRFYGNNITYMIDVAMKWEEGDMKSALILVIANHMKKCYLSWNKETVEDEVIFNHLLELSDGKINLFKSNEELSNSHNLMKVNKKMSNKSQFNSNNKNSNTKNIHKKKSINPKNQKRK
ncbi:hypothetical protein SY27_05330 [Flavobacterium sp. 316]|uniref:DUF4290 domain-containing protein n=1 Tax=Flavobacterium sediminilitoris TaxID=2024526 RepID=A0ABY4HI58_9FLAO|nr:MULTISPECIES: DUF4290 domain-containing protein [Flavobacterium]KIX22089.1 hypothetical protein SY27_05330 [Flavobacterium sp. 316]UOX32331.1 DUF4290 domain-containing protein [Flavobacterium sediminilitoris]